MWYQKENKEEKKEKKRKIITDQIFWCLVACLCVHKEKKKKKNGAQTDVKQISAIYQFFSQFQFNIVYKSE